jgi:acyl-CoA synthetase (AMP-forming)/AMP-acid ligase II
MNLGEQNMSHDHAQAGTIWHKWCENADKSANSVAVVHWKAGEAPFRWTWGELIQAGRLYAAAFVSRGIQRGEVCAIICRHNPLFYPIYFGCVCAGAIPAVLAYQNPRLHPDKFRAGLEGMGMRSGLDWILTERALEDVLRPLLGSGRSTINGLHFPFERAEYLARVEPRNSGEEPALRASDPLLLQHSSGTTGLQKPVLLSHGTVLGHVTEYARFLEISHADKIVSWLPLYHDMGLIAAFHLPLALGIPTIQIDPFEWVLAPSLLLEVISVERATMTWLPNFAFSMMADKIKEEDLEDVTLDTCRMLINCSEPVRHRDQEKFLRRFGTRGLRREALSSCYAMAETTFAVTQTPPGRQPTTLAVDAQALSKGIASQVSDDSTVKVCESSGELILGCEIRIVDENFSDVEEGRVGEVLIKTRWMFEGYRNYPEKTAAAIRDGWYISGDYGFRCGNDYYIIGRKKDIIIIAGNNIYPEDVEAAINDLDGVIPGRVVAFGEEDVEFGSERLSVVVETPLTDEAKLKQLRKAILMAGMSIDVSITNVYLVSPRFLIKSSAGKPSRSANKDRVLRLRDSESPRNLEERRYGLRRAEISDPEGA